MNFTGFEAWWKSQSGATDPDIPVLPEFMVMKIEDKVRSEALWRTTVSKGSPTATPESEADPRRPSLLPAPSGTAQPATAAAGPG